METLYNKKHLQLAMVSSFVVGLSLSLIIIRDSDATTASLVVQPPKVEADNSLHIKTQIWDVIKVIEDPVWKDLVEEYAIQFIYLQKHDGMPVSVRFAQMILESGLSKSNPKGSLIFQNGKNPFGIRYWRDNYPSRISNWEERIDGYVEVPSGKYLKFKSIADAFYVHSDFVTKGHYAAYVKEDSLVPSYKVWVEALAVKPPKKMRYAEDPNYAKKLLSLISKNQLHKLDSLYLY